MGNRTIVPAALAWWSPQVDPGSAALVAAHRDSEGKTAFGAVVVFTFILLLAPQNRFPSLAPLRIAFLTAGVAVASLLWNRWRRWKPLGFTREMLPCLALAVWAFLTLPLSYWVGGSVAALTEYIKAVTVFWLLANVVTTMRRLRLLAALLILCTVPLAGTALRNFAAGTFIQGGDSSVRRIWGYEAGLALNPNDLAFLLNLLIPLGIALFLSTERTSVRVLCLTVLGMNVVAVILTFSRAGFLGLATIGIVYFAKLVRRPGPDRSWAFAALVLALSSLPLLPSSYVDRLATVTDIEADPTGSARIRWHDNIDAIHFVIEHPIVGAGIGMDILALNDVRGLQWRPVHNVYLQFAVDLGLPGIVLFLMLFYGVFRTVRSSRRRVVGVPAFRDLFFLAEGVEVSLIVFAVAGFFHPAAYHFYFYYVGGLALATRSTIDAATSVTKVINDADHETAVLHAGGEMRRFVTNELA